MGWGRHSFQVGLPTSPHFFCSGALCTLQFVICPSYWPTVLSHQTRWLLTMAPIYVPSKTGQQHEGFRSPFADPFLSTSIERLGTREHPEPDVRHPGNAIPSIELGFQGCKCLSVLPTRPKGLQLAAYILQSTLLRPLTFMRAFGRPTPGPARNVWVDMKLLVVRPRLTRGLAVLSFFQK